MFHFGVFSNLLPYLIIAAIYLCGLASYSAGLANTHLANKQNGAYFCNDFGTHISSNEIYQYVYIKHSIYKSIINDNDFITQNVENLYVHFIKSEKASKGYYYILFSRPPPHLSLLF